jgi:CBS domain-containing protein
MSVKAILAHKGSNVVTVEPSVSLATAVAVLSECRIGALVVTGPDRRVIGIISERDIVKAVAEHSAGALDSPVAEFMTRKVVTCGSHETIAELMERMTAGKFRHVPVLDQGRLAGIISIGDVVKWRLEELSREQEALQDYIRTA